MRTRYNLNIPINAITMTLQWLTQSSSSKRHESKDEIFYIRSLIKEIVQPSIETVDNYMNVRCSLLDGAYTRG